MPQWRQHDASNEPGTCKWCGNELRKAWKGYQTDDQIAAGEPRPLGDYADGHFCGLRCGYRFGRAFADFGKTLNPRNKS